MKEDLKIVDLCKNGAVGSSEWETEFKFQLCSCFSCPVYEKGDYLLSQYISEYAKNQYYDGIAFLSAFANGKNITIFNYDKCKAVKSSLYLTKSVDIDYKQF